MRLVKAVGQTVNDQVLKGCEAPFYLVSRSKDSVRARNVTVKH